MCVCVIVVDMVDHECHYSDKSMLGLEVKLLVGGGSLEMRTLPSPTCVLIR